jgi:hypothetical protein
MCGERFGAMWALNIDAVTCRRCRELGMPIHIHYWVNTR